MLIQQMSKWHSVSRNKTVTVLLIADNNTKVIYKDSEDGTIHSHPVVNWEIYFIPLNTFDIAYCIYADDCE